jgi:hypothetical protein
MMARMPSKTDERAITPRSEIPHRISKMASKIVDSDIIYLRYVYAYATPDTR